MSRCERRVAILLDQTYGWCLPILEGIAHYVQARHGWRVAMRNAERSEYARVLRAVEADGIIYAPFTTQAVDIARSRRIPAVNVAGYLDHPPKGSVLGDDEACGRLAAEFFLDNGFRSFMGFQQTSRRFARLRLKGYVGRLKEAGYPCPVCRTVPQALSRFTDAQDTARRPVAVFAESDPSGAALLDGLQQAGVHVPNDAAVLGAGNQTYPCELCSPQLSSVDGNIEQRGYDAAVLLDRLMDGEPAPAEPTLVTPRGVISRASTDAVAVRDRDVARAMDFIRRRADEPIQAADVADALPCSRRSLDQKFLAVLGRTVHEEIWRRHLHRARNLLNYTDLSLCEVAVRSGFRSASALSIIFKRHTGVSPREYRRRGKTPRMRQREKDKQDAV